MSRQADYTAFHQISEHVEKRIMKKKVTDNAIDGRRRKIQSAKNGVRLLLHSRET